MAIPPERDPKQFGLEYIQLPSESLERLRQWQKQMMYEGVVKNTPSFTVVFDSTGEDMANMAVQQRFPHSNVVANRILDHMKKIHMDYGSATFETPAMFDRLYENPRDGGEKYAHHFIHKFRDVLEKLWRCGMINRTGQGKYKWSLKYTEWNREIPFATRLGCPPASEYEGKDLSEKDEDDDVAKSEYSSGRLRNDVPVTAQNVLQPNNAEITSLKTRINDLAKKVEDQHAKIQLLQEEKIEDKKDYEEQLSKLKNGVKYIKVELPNGKTKKIDAVPHKQLDKVVKLVSKRFNTALIGPSGSGKTYLAKQVADVLGLDFSFITCSAGLSEGQLLGRLLPVGEKGKFEYVRSEFVRIFEEGGLWLFDEADAMDSNTALVMNSALSSPMLAVPNRKDNPTAKKHKDFVCVIAMNTYGNGADRQYVGRSQQDAAFLDRFRIGQVIVDYDLDLEAKLCPDDTLRNRLQGYRRKMMEAKVRQIISTRFLIDSYRAKEEGVHTDEEIDTALFAGWRLDEIEKVKSNGVL